MDVNIKIQKILSRFPYELSNNDIRWVSDTMSKISPRAKLAQLINIQVLPGDEAVLAQIVAQELGAFSVINFSDAAACRDAIEQVKKGLSVPPLVCADIEGGVTSGQVTTSFPNQLGCAAANSVDTYGKALTVLSKELRALGVNWTFSPVLDVNQAIHSAIVGTRSFGSDVSLIGEMAGRQIQVFQDSGIATTAKHWPGEGFDDRDQHLVTTINPMPMDEWSKVFGNLYNNAIREGVWSIMSAHIALPEYARQRGAEGVEVFRPASISRLLNQKLLREELQFNGLIISDATLMGGLESWGARKEWLPEVIENGCDMILFTTTLADDLATLEQAIESGALSPSRVDEALIRVLGLKAKLKLNRTSSGDCISIDVIDSADHREVMQQLSDLSPTLIKNVNHVLPIDTSRVKKILLFKEENVNPLGGGEAFRLRIDELLEKEGFDVKVFNPASDSLSIASEFDLIIYAVAQESQLTKSHIYLDWGKMHGGTLPAMKRLWWDTPTVIVSFGHPYYLLDAPRVPCLINAYTPTPEVQMSVVQKMLGRSEFTGKSPVDAFCGLVDAHF